MSSDRQTNAPSDAEPDDPTEGSAANAAAATAPAPDPREYLTRVGDTRLFLLAGDEQSWQFPGDALVIPTDPGRNKGQFAEALLSSLSSSAPDLYSFVDGLFGDSGKPALEPDGPEVFTTPGSTNDVPKYLGQLILATALDDKRATAGLRAAWSAVIRAADDRQIGCLVVPMFGVGKGGLGAQPAAAAAAAVLLSARPRHVREITVLTLNSEAANELRARCSAQPQSLANDLASGDDLLDIEVEVRALADVLMLRETRPPLVVGVLGGWGMGKSFVMNLMQERMREVRSWALSAEEAWGGDVAKRSPFVGHLYPIRFDAWTYAKGNLWASLMQTIVFELNRQLSLEQKLAKRIKPLEESVLWRQLDKLSDAARATWLENELGLKVIDEALESGKSLDLDTLWAQLKLLKEQEHKDLEAIEKTLAEQRAKLAAEQKRLAEKVESEIERVARWAAWKPLLREMKGISGRLYDEFVRSVQELTGETRPQGEAPTLSLLLGKTSFWWKIKKARAHERIGFVVAAAAAAAAPFLEGALDAWQAPTWIVAAGSALMAVQRSWTTWANWLADQQAGYEKQVLEERARLDGLRAEIAEKQRSDHEAAARKQRATTLSDLEQAVATLEAKARAQRERIGFTAGYVSLAKFVESRLGEGLYEKQLGLLHQVQRDLTEISESLVVDDKDPHLDKKREIFPRGMPRVVLFIDDLDRCPPDSVVEVLEAAQLLVKSELFVVVIAMDLRFVTRALEKHYEGILVRKGDPCGLDYIEKIVQVPYRVRPIEPSALQQYLRRQMNLKEQVVQAQQSPGGPTGQGASQPPSAQGSPSGAKVHRAPPPQVLQFTATDHAMLTACCKDLDLTPRSLKRLVNVCKLLKIIWYRSARHVEPTAHARQAMMLLLALSARYPDVLRQPLDAIAEAVEAGSTVALSAFARSYRLLEQDRLSKQEWAEVVAVLTNPTRLPPKLRLDEIGLPTINLVRAFSFVGDAGHEPDDAFTPPRRARLSKGRARPPLRAEVGQRR
jgi:predicted KAP-like P-loop ATPase